MKTSQNNQLSLRAGLPPSQLPRIAPGVTLIELTVVILVLMSLITILFFGARAWKRGSDRTLCIMQIQQVQQGLRSFSNLYGYDPGATVPGLKSQIIGLGRFVEVTPSCPTDGTYSFENGENLIPPLGSLYMTCSLDDDSDDAHVPDSYEGW